MNILAIDNSFNRFSAGIMVGDECDHRLCAVEDKSSEVALDTIDELLRNAEVALSEIDRFALTVGPGRFSGIRLACAIVQTFAYIHRKPICGYSTLYTIAHRALCALRNAAPTDAIAPEVTVLLNAHQGHSYCGEFYYDATIEDYRYREPPYIIAHDNIDVAAHCIDQRDEEFIAPHSADFISLARHHPADELILDPMTIAPLYVNEKVAMTIAERMESGR